MQANAGRQQAKIDELRRERAEIEARGRRALGVLEAEQANAAQGSSVAVELSATDKTRLDVLNKQLHDERLVLSTLEDEADELREIAKLRSDMAKGSGAAAANTSAADALAAERARALIRDLDAERARFEVELELSQPIEEALQPLTDSANLAADAARALADAERDRLAAMERDTANAISSIGSGTSGSFVAGALLPVAGAAIGNMVPGVGGAVGSGIGSGLASILGPLMDTLIDKLGVLTPVLDALGTVVSALSPIFGILGAVAGLVASVLELLAPIILAWSEMVGALLAPLLRVIETVLPIFLMQFAIIIPIVQLFGEMLVALVDVIDTYVLLPIARAATWLYNSIVDVVNSLVAVINGLMGALGIAIDLETLSRMRDPQSLSDMGVAGADLTRAVDDNTEELKEFNRSLTNLPAGFRYNLAEYRAENPDGRGTPIGARSMAARGSMVINGPVYVTARTAALAEEIGRNMRQRGFPFGGPPGSSPPKRN